MVSVVTLISNAEENKFKYEQEMPQSQFADPGRSQ